MHFIGSCSDANKFVLMSDMHCTGNGNTQLVPLPTPNPLYCRPSMSNNNITLSMINRNIGYRSCSRMLSGATFTRYQLNVTIKVAKTSSMPTADNKLSRGGDGRADGRGFGINNYDNRQCDDSTQNLCECQTFKDKCGLVISQ